VGSRCGVRTHECYSGPVQSRRQTHHR
jgi:hypothetical protein